VRTARTPIILPFIDSDTSSPPDEGDDCVYGTDGFSFGSEHVKMGNDASEKNPLATLYNIVYIAVIADS
jgi:hypothetical protein